MSRPKRKRCPPPCGKLIYKTADDAHDCIRRMPEDKSYMRLGVYLCQMSEKGVWHVGHREIATKIEALKARRHV